MRELTTVDLRDLALGATVLGTGGGGDPYVGRLLAERQLRSGRRIRVISAEELDADDLVIPTSIWAHPP